MNKRAKIMVAAILLAAAVAITAWSMLAGGSPGANSKVDSHAQEISEHLRAMEDPPPPPSLPPPERRGPRKGE